MEVYGRQMEGAASTGAAQRERSRKDAKRTKASKAQKLFEEEVERPRQSACCGGVRRRHGNF
jgi:hypothetical protein